MTDRFMNKYRIPTTRAKWHDYSGGAYFVTACTQDREPYFGHIADGQLSYTDLGLTANDCLQAIPSHFPNAEIPKWIVMPNHIHAIIIINAPTPTVETQNLASLQGETLQKFGPQSKNLASIVRGFKIGVTKFANEHHLSFAWQPRFHDHIIRNQYEMNRIGDYIRNNVARWKEDCYYNTANKPISKIPEMEYLQFF